MPQKGTQFRCHYRGVFKQTTWRAVDIGAIYTNGIHLFGLMIEAKQR